MEKIVVKKKNDKQKAKIVRYIFNIFFTLFFTLSFYLLSKALEKFSSSSVPLILMSVAIITVIVFIMYFFYLSKNSQIDTIEIDTNTISFNSPRSTFKVDKNNVNAIIVERESLDNYELTNFKFLIKQYPDNFKNFVKDENNFCYNNKDINDVAQGQEVQHHIEFLKKYYGDILLVKNLKS